MHYINLSSGRCLHCDATAFRSTKTLAYCLVCGVLFKRSHEPSQLAFNLTSLAST